MNIRFAIYEHNLVYYKGMLITRHFIVVKDDKNYIVSWTNFGKYIKTEKTKQVKSIQSVNKQKYYIVIRFLNYCFFEKYSIEKLIDIEPSMLQSFLNDYSKLELESNRKAKKMETVERNLNYLLDFMIELSHNNKVSFCEDDLYENKDVFSKKYHKYITKRIPKFTVYHTNEAAYEIFRDMPIEAFKVIADVILTNYPQIIMITMSEAFAGLRGAEGCCLRGEDSPLGPGILFEYVDGKVMNITLDISLEINLRADLKRTGRIKKERYQKVYIEFIPAFCQCYNLYLKFLSKRKRDMKYGALTVDRNGNAMTYDTYLKTFKRVIKDAIPIMLSSQDPELANYGHLLLKKEISPHIFRHWFSMMLVLFGETEASLMKWRGDSSPESAMTYINNKSEIIKQLRHTKNEIFNYEMAKAERLWKKSI